MPPWILLKYSSLLLLLALVSLVGRVIGIRQEVLYRVYRNILDLVARRSTRTRASLLPLLAYYRSFDHRGAFTRPPYLSSFEKLRSGLTLLLRLSPGLANKLPSLLFVVVFLPLDASDYGDAHHQTDRAHVHLAE